MSDRRTCETCRFWMGGAKSFQGDCVNPELYASRPPFDKADCKQWQAIPQPAVQVGKPATLAQGTTWQQMKAKGTMP